MKEVLLIVIALITTTALPAQDVPESVQKSLVKMYPGVADIEWEIDDDGEDFEATFILDGEDYRVKFDEFGTWMESERVIEYEQLPEKVQTFVSKYYPNATVVRVGERENEDRGIYYGIIFDIDGRPSLVMFSREGQPIK